MSENLLYCLLGIGGGAVCSFLISWFFFYIGNCEKIIYIDIITIGKSRDLKNDFVCLMKNIGRSPLFMTDFAPLNRPHFMAKEFSNLFTVIPPYKTNYNNASVRIENENAYVFFDYLNKKESIIIVFKGSKGIVGYKATMIGGIEIHYKEIISIIKKVKLIASSGMIINIASIILSFNIRRGLAFSILGFVLWYTITTHILYHYVMSNHLKLLKYLNISP